MKSLNQVVLFLLGLLFCQFINAQDSTAIKKLNSFAQHFSIFAKDYPQEKVYLHFDNTAYRLGETMWFKAYVVTAERNALSQLSKTLYVELVTAEGDVLETKKLKIDNGQCSGEFQLKDSLFSGFYEVRAYTRYMLNQEKEYLFSRVFPVYEKPKKAGDYSTPKIRERYRSQKVPQFRKEYEQKGKLALSFFPEGGNLVLGNNSKVAFKATGKEGDDAIITGNILNQQGISVAELNSSFEGMGSFEFTPDSGKYTAKVQYNNKEYTFGLPPALLDGYTMTVNNANEETMDVLIQKNSVKNNEPLGLSVSCRGRLYGFEQLSVGDANALRLTFPKKMLPSGVIQITLFNSNGNVLCERLAFVNHHSEMKIQMTQNKSYYKPYEKVDLNFQLNDIRNNPIDASFSVAIHDESTSLINPYNDNLLTNLLLSSELKGYIENPGYYFASENLSRREALDLLLLTQGWSRYLWKQMAGTTPYEVKQPIEKSLVIDGTVLSLFKKKPKENVNVSMLLICDSTSQRGTCPTDQEGKFNLALIDFYGNSKLSIETKEKAKRIETNIILNRVFSPEMKAYDYSEMIFPDFITAKQEKIISLADTMEINVPEKEKVLPINRKNHILPEVTVKEKKKWGREGEGIRNANIVIDVEKSVDHLIDKRESEPATISGFLMLTNKYFTEASASSDKFSYKGREVIFVLNNNLISVDRLNIEYIPDEIELITICDRDGLSILYGSSTGDEVVVFLYTYKDHHSRNNLYGIRQTNFQGYSYAKEFFNPRYDIQALPNEKDYRRTLYWNPNVRTDKDGKATVTFYNNSTCKTMTVSAETVTENGVIGVLNR